MIRIDSATPAGLMIDCCNSNQSAIPCRAISLKSQLTSHSSIGRAISSMPIVSCRPTNSRKNCESSVRLMTWQWHSENNVTDASGLMNDESG